VITACEPLLNSNTLKTAFSRGRHENHNAINKSNAGVDAGGVE